MTVYDAQGRVAARIAERAFAAGEHRIVWDGTDLEGRNLRSGLYFLELWTPERRLQRRLVHLRTE